MIHLGINTDAILERVTERHAPPWDALVEELTEHRARAGNWRDVGLLDYLRRADALINAMADDMTAEMRAAVDGSRLGRRARRIFVRNLPRMRADLVTRRWQMLGGWTPAKAAAVIAQGEATDAAADDAFDDLLAEALEE